MTKEWEHGFQAGALWAAAYVAGDLVDQPTIAMEICRAAGITLRDLKSADIADREAAQKIIAEFLMGPNAEIANQRYTKALDKALGDGTNVYLAAPAEAPDLAAAEAQGILASQRATFDSEHAAAEARLQAALEWETGLKKALLPYQERAVKAEAQLDALTAENERLKQQQHLDDAQLHRRTDTIVRLQTHVDALTAEGVRLREQGEEKNDKNVG